MVKFHVQTILANVPLLKFRPMRKLFFLLFFGLGTSVFAQDYNRSSLGFSIGGHDGLHNTLHTTRIYQFTHYEANYRYMFNNRVGLKFDAGFDNFKFTDGHPATKTLRFSIQPTFNLTDLLHFDDFSSKLGLQLHVGGGYATMWNKTQMKTIDTVVERYETRVEVVKGDTVKVYIDDAKTLADAGIYEVLFVKGSFYLNIAYHGTLNNLVAYMNANPGLKIGVIGHADTDGEDDVNNKLSAARAEVVTNYLVSKGIAKERLVVSFKGKSETKYPGKTLEVDAANRRVSFSIIR